MKVKLCSRCGAEFNSLTNSVRCVSCRIPHKSERSARLYSENIVKRRFQIREYAQANRITLAAARKKWRAENRDRVAGYSKKYWALNPEKQRRKRQIQKFREWGITEDRYRDILVSQGGGCAICAGLCVSGRQLAVDHDHETGKIRGLLCARCNNGLGNFTDNSALLLRAASYLEDRKAAEDLRIADLKAKGILS